MRLSAGARQRRRRFVGRWIVAPLALLALLGAAFWFGREVGGFEADARIGALEARIGETEARERAAERLRAQAEQALASASAQAQARIESLAARVPHGELGALLDLLRARLDQGVPPERLRFVLSEAAPVRACRQGVAQRRFAPRLPSGVAPLQTVAFLDNRITVSATASPAVAEDGSPRPGFDAGRKVEIRVLRIGGNIELVEGVLPLGHSVVADGREYRFGFASVANDTQIEVTLQDCAYP
ncbi:hypothetical protein [Geminicoccus roseus]|uniref:hypothetical protein n=1 Tax=Geminicoccus roseus TaxID=404900 RepID=UPI0004145665|nr:hypothetical protein [Geminicoccus roseus]